MDIFVVKNWGMRILDLDSGWWWWDEMIERYGWGWQNYACSLRVSTSKKNNTKCGCIVRWDLMMDNWQTWTIKWEGTVKRMTEKRLWFCNRNLDNFVCVFDILFHGLYNFWPFKWMKSQYDSLNPHLSSCIMASVGPLMELFCGFIMF